MGIGIGVVVRDERGGFVAAMTKVIPFIFDSTSAEAVAVWDKKKKKKGSSWYITHYWYMGVG